MNYTWIDSKVNSNRHYVDNNGEVYFTAIRDEEGLWHVLGKKFISAEAAETYVEKCYPNSDAP